MRIVAAMSSLNTPPVAPRVRRLAASLAMIVGICSFLALSPPSAHASGRDSLQFGENGPIATFGANAVIAIDGSITFNDDCPKGGIDDFVFPATDVYVVQPGTGHDSKLEDVGGRPNTIVSNATLFTDETIAVTAPSGHLGNGVYDVVYDTCQDGGYDPGVDTVFEGAITVALPQVLPPASDAIANMKGGALVEYASWLATRLAMEQMFKLADQALKAQCEVGNPIGCAMKKLDYFGGIKKRFLQLMLSEANHYLAIGLDPPDPAFQQVTSMTAINEPTDVSDSPVSTATAAVLLPMATEGAVSEALLHAVERYQGAVAAGDAGWALEHAREAQNLATVLAQATTATSTALVDLRTAMANEPDLAAGVTAASTFANRIWSVGFDPQERRALRNAGLNATQIADLETEVRDAGNIGLALPQMLAALDTSLAAHATTGPSAVATAAKWADVASTLAASPGVVSAGPGASAGGPYTSLEGAGLVLQGSAGTTVDSAAWDLDGDGSFDDANGLKPTVSFATAGVHLIGLRVAAGPRVSVAYATVTTTDSAHAPQLSSPAPAQRSATVTVGASQAFSVSATDADNNPINFAWTLDGTSLPSTGNSSTFTPTLAQVGNHVVQVTASDGTAGGGTTRRTWDVIVLAPDTDGDGWTATPDCDDSDPEVHPSSTERLGNGIDDDCDPSTPDAPPGGLVGSILSWGANHNGTIGTGSFSPTLVDTPVPVPGLDNVVQVESTGDRGSLAVLANGEVRSWGFNGAGNLGDGTMYTPVATPVSPLPVGGGNGRLTGVTQISAEGHVVARRVDGTVVAWGDNQGGESGDGSTVNSHPYPVQVLSAAGGPPLSGVKAVEAGYVENYALMDDGTVRAWGQIRCNGGTNISISPFPMTLGLVGNNVRQVSSGNQWTMFLKKDGTVLSCGAFAPAAGRPVPTMSDVYTPLPLTGFGPGSGAVDIASGYEGGLVLKDDGSVWAWGYNANGSLNVVGGGPSIPAPLQVPLPPGPPVIDIDQDNACHALALRADGSLLSWGCDFFEQIGNGPGGAIVGTPTVIPTPGRSVVSVSNSAWNSLVLTRPIDDPEWERPETWVNASVADAQLDEGTGGGFDITLSAALPHDVTVDYKLTPDTATADDVDLASGTVTIPAGSTTAHAAVTVHDDTLDEDAETFSIVLSDASNGIQLPHPRAIGTITDNDDAPSVSVEPVTVAEGNTPVTDAPVRVKLSHASGKPVSFKLATSDGTATAPSDYSAASVRLTIPPGATETIFHLVVHGDAVAEPDEGFTVSLADPENAVLGQSSAIATITDDEPLVVVVTSPVVPEGDSGVVSATFTVTLDPAPPVGTAVTIPYTVEGLTASIPADLAAASGTLQFAAGAGPQQISVAINGDTVVEPREAFRLTVGTPVVTGSRLVVIGDNPVAFIDDDDDVTGTPPVVGAGPDRLGVEGAVIALDGTVSDADPGDTLVSTWTYQAGAGVDGGAVCTFASPTSVDTTIKCTDDGIYTATLTVTDGQAHIVTDSATVAVGNVGPQVHITAPSAGSTVLVGSTVTVTASITDPGANDTLTCSINWGDGTVVSAPIANGTCSGPHAYGAAGGRTVTVTATDDDGGSTSDAVGLTVAATSSNGTVTGNGAIVVGGAKTSFSFTVSRHNGGVCLQLEINSGANRFLGSTVSSFVVTGKTAEWKGTGRWNGKTGYTYRIAVEDRTGQPDTISIEIRNPSGAIVFTASGPLQSGYITVK
jgi:alpha-tubulin suppressor-like RCC1 family protein